MVFYHVVGVKINNAELALLIALDHRENAMTLFDAMLAVEERNHKDVQNWLFGLQAKGILRPWPDHNGVDEWMYQDNDTAQAVFHAIHHMDIQQQ